MEATTKLQKAERAFLLRLVAKYGPLEAARILRSLAAELEAPWRPSNPWTNRHCAVRFRSTDG